MTTLADATQESINAAIEERLGGKGGGDRGGDGKNESKEIQSLKDKLYNLQSQLNAPKNGGGGINGGGSNGGDSNGGDDKPRRVQEPVCPKCGKRHKVNKEGQCWFSAEKDKAPEWFRRHHPKIWPPGKDNSE